MANQQLSFPARIVNDQRRALLSDCAFGLQIVGAFEKDGQKLPHSLTGKWDTALEATMPDGTKQRIWTIHPMPAETTRCAAGAASHQFCTSSPLCACKRAVTCVASPQALVQQGSILMLVVEKRKEKKRLCLLASI